MTCIDCKACIEQEEDHCVCNVASVRIVNQNEQFETENCDGWCNKCADYQTCTLVGKTIQNGYCTRCFYCPVVNEPQGRCRLTKECDSCTFCEETYDEWGEVIDYGWGMCKYRMAVEDPDLFEYILKKYPSDVYGVDE